MKRIQILDQKGQKDVYLKVTGFVDEVQKRMYEEVGRQGGIMGFVLQCISRLVMLPPIRDRTQHMKLDSDYSWSAAFVQIIFPIPLFRGLPPRIIMSYL